MQIRKAALRRHLVGKAYGRRARWDQGRLTPVGQGRGMSKYPIKNLSMERVTSKVPQTRTARMARARLGYLMSGFGDEAGLYHNVQERVPEAWATLAEDLPCEEPRVKITIRLDQSVARFYRAMGKGYQARMNRVLATYAQMQIGEVQKDHEVFADLLHNHGVDRITEMEEGRSWRK